jgi:hypothetical protein
MLHTRARTFQSFPCLPICDDSTEQWLVVIYCEWPWLRIRVGNVKSVERDRVSKDCIKILMPHILRPEMQILIFHHGRVKYT